VVSGSSTVGGGSAPGSAIPTRLIALAHDRLASTQIESQLRKGNPPIIARIEEDRVVLDLRTVLPEQEDSIVSALSVL
jgi:L-seryl-tRNA(Ser) seleniumtransferase